MSEAARWNLKVSRDTDVALRTLLATRGGRKGDLSKFVEDAVNAAVLRETVRDVQGRNAGRTAEEISQLVVDELADLGPTFWVDRRH